MKFCDFRCIAATSLVLFVTTLVGAQNYLARDDSSDPAYADGWQDGDNGGFGFGPWTLEPSTEDNRTTRINVTDMLLGNIYEEPEEIELIRTSDDSFFYAESFGYLITFPFFMSANSEFSREINAFNNLSDGTTFSFIRRADLNQNIRTVLMTNSCRVDFPPVSDVAFQSFTFYPSENKITRMTQNLLTNLTFYAEHDYCGQPLGFEFTNRFPGGNIASAIGYYNDFRVVESGYGSAYLINELPLSFSISGSQEDQTVTLQTNSLTTGTKGMVFGRQEYFDSNNLKTVQEEFANQQFELTGDEEIEFENISVTLSYDPSLLGSLRENDIQFVERIDETPAVRIPCTVDTEANTIRFETDDWGTFVPGGLLDSSNSFILARDDSSDPAYDDRWGNGDNGGFGFGNWGVEIQTNADRVTSATVADEVSGQQFKVDEKLLEPVRASDGSFFLIDAESYYEPFPATSGIFTLIDRNFLDSNAPLVDGTTFSMVFYGQRSTNLLVCFGDILANCDTGFRNSINSEGSYLFQWQFFPSQNKMIRTTTVLETNATGSNELELENDPSRFHMYTYFSQGLVGKTFGCFNHLSMHDGSVGSSFLTNELPLEFSIPGTLEEQMITLKANDLTSGTRGMVFGRQESIVPPDLEANEIALTRQQFEITGDEEIEFESLTVTINYDPLLLGRVSEDDIQFVQKIDENTPFRILSAVDTELNTITFQTEDWGTFVPGGLKSPDIDVRDSWLSF